jgi:hypothetical protein
MMRKGGYMKDIFRWFVFPAVVSLTFLLPYDTARAEPFKFSSSTQFLWGDDLLGDSQAIVAQYLRFNYNPEGKPLSVTGYGRIWKDLNGGSIRDNDLSGRLYSLSLEYAPVEKVSLRLGRQFIAYTAEKALMDGVRIDAHNIGPIGISAAGGREVIFSLDSESSRSGNYLIGFDIHLENVKSTQLGISYVRKYDQWDLAREEFGANFRYIYKFLSPYAEVRYDRLSKTFDEVTAGIDIFPAGNMLIKAEFYQSFPTFDSTSIYSVFAVNKYREYLVRAEYTFEAPVTVFASYARQTYEDSENADNYILGVRVYPMKNLVLSASVDNRHGFGGKLWGFEVTGDYRLKKELVLSAGAQYDTYMRPDQFGNNYAQRYWIGGQWFFGKDFSLIARVEEDINENFNHRTLGRLALNWNL